MHTPTQTERQALDAAIDTVCGVERDPIVLHDIVAPPATMGWHRPLGCAGWANGDFWHSFQRTHGNPRISGWFGHERLTDQHGRVWSRKFDAVIDDFGNLVEVPQ